MTKPSLPSQKRQTAEDAHEALEQELLTASHELKAPLTSILGALSLVRGDRIPQSERKAELIDVALRNAYRLRLRLATFFDAQKLCRGMVVCNVQANAVYPLIESALRDVNELAETTKVDIKLTEKTTAVACCDHRGMVRSLGYLLSDAIERSPAGSGIEIGITSDHQHVTVAVTLSGADTLSEYRLCLVEKDLLEILTLAHASRMPRLVLGVVRAWVEAMGGILSVDQPSAGRTRAHLKLGVCQAESMDMRDDSSS